LLSFSWLLLRLTPVEAPRDGTDDEVFILLLLLLLFFATIITIKSSQSK